MSNRAELEEMLRRARLVGAERTVASLERELEELDRPKPQEVIDCERAAELSGEYRRAKHQGNGGRQRVASDAEIEEMLAPGPDSLIFERQMKREVEFLVAELKRLGISKKPGGPA